jgi:DNA-binding NtrC family response regulator
MSDASARCRSIVVLLVDDDESFRSGVAANLTDDGHTVHACAHPAEVTGAQLAAADVVVTDFHMAETDGITFADRVHRVRAHVMILLVTAYWTVEVEAAAATRPHVELRRKPLDYDDLHARIHELAIAA